VVGNTRGNCETPAAKRAGDVGAEVDARGEVLEMLAIMTRRDQNSHVWSGYHLEIVSVLKAPVTVLAVEMIIVFVSLSLFRIGPGLVAHRTHFGEVVQGVHMLPAAGLAAKLPSTCVALVIGA
jgi:hypothetical protein